MVYLLAFGICFVSEFLLEINSAVTKSNTSQIMSSLSYTPRKPRLRNTHKSSLIKRSQVVNKKGFLSLAASFILLSF